MNKYGAILDDFGLETMLHRLMEDFISPLSKGEWSLQDDFCSWWFDQLCLCIYSLEETRYCSHPPIGFSFSEDVF